MMKTKITNTAARAVLGDVFTGLTRAALAGTRPVSVSAGPITLAA